MKIYPEFDSESAAYVLMCDDGRMRPMPAGPRLFRAAPHPEVAFTHETLEAAQADCAKLRSYFAWLKTRKK